MSGSGEIQGKDVVFDASGDLHNNVSGTVQGPSVQARDVHGGVHIHHTTTDTPTPSQLPPPSRLVGRLEELAVLDTASAGGQEAATPGVVVVSGMAGIGKTALALAWAHAHRERFPDGQLYADLGGHADGGPVQPSEVLGGFLRALGVEPSRVPVELAERAALFRSWVADRRVVMVLDDAVSAAQVRPLLPATPASVAVVTSRWRLAGLVAHGAKGVQVERLGRTAAVTLLTHMVGEQRVADDPEAAAELVQLCAGLPLAVCVAGARLAARPQWGLNEMVRALSHERQRLAALVVEEDVAVQSALDLSHAALPGEAATLYRLLGLCPATSFTPEVAAAAATIPRERARHLLEVLADANLCTDVAADRYRFHDLVRLHARQRAHADEPDDVRDTALRRMLDWYLHAAASAEETLRPYRRDLRRDVTHPPAEPVRFSGAGEALAWLETERATLDAAARCAFDNELYTLAWQLVDATWPLYQHHGHHHARLAGERLALDAARRCDDAYAEAKMADRLGLTLNDLEEFEEAAELFTRARQLWSQVGDHRRTAGSLRRLGLVRAGQHRFDAAIAAFTDALDAYRTLGHARETGLTLIDLGDAHTRTDRPGAATTHLRRARELLTDADDPYNQARAGIKLGRAHALAGDGDAAAGQLAQALESMHAIGSPIGQADALEALGELAEHTGHPDQARSHYQHAHDILANHDARGTTHLAEHLRRLDQAR